MSSVRFEQVPGDLPVVAVVDEGLGNASWVVALDGPVAVVDPERDAAPYAEVASRLGGPVTLAVETHLHADFVTGSRELAATGADVVAAAAGHLAWPHRPVADGDEIALGDWALRVLATPGHTPEHVAYLLLERGDPRAVFTGGSLLVGAVARTDLIAPDATEPLTRALWRSLHQELLALPDDVAVFPTHGAGSFCSAAGGARRWSTIGHERGANPLLQADSEDDFVARVLAGFGSYPPYFRRLREVNRRGPLVYRSFPSLRTLTVEEVTEARERGVVIDVRPVADYVAGHVPGSLASTLRPQFASWLGWLVADPATPLVFVTDERTDRRELVRQCLTIGYEDLAGEIDIGTWRVAGGEITTMELVHVGQLHGRRVLDVRQAGEFASGHVPGAVHVELGALADDADTLGDEPLVVMCGHGERAATAASLLEAAGRDGVAVLRGGPADWSAVTGGRLQR